MCNAQNHTVDLYNCSSYHMPRRVRVCAVEWRKARAAGAARPLTLITLKTSERYSALSGVARFKSGRGGAQTHSITDQSCATASSAVSLATSSGMSITSGNEETRAQEERRKKEES